MDLGEFWVCVPEIYEWNSPGGEPVNRVYRGQKLVVYEQHAGWGRVTADGFDARWVRMNALGRTAFEGDFASVPREWLHPSIRSLPARAADGLSLEDVQILWAGANMILETYPGSMVVEGDRSTTRVDTYFVILDPRLRKYHFKRADVIEWQLAKNARGD